MKNIQSYDEFLMESTAPQGYIKAEVKKGTIVPKFKYKFTKDTDVYIDALQYSKRGDNEEIDVVFNGTEMKIIKQDISVKF